MVVLFVSIIFVLFRRCNIGKRKKERGKWREENGKKKEELLIGFHSPLS
jgi:hypothetical protein